MPKWNKCSWKRPPRRYLKTTPTILSIVVTVVRKSLLAWRITRIFFIASTHIENTYLGAYYRLKCKIKIQSIHIIWWIVGRILCNLITKYCWWPVINTSHSRGRERESTIFGHEIVKVVQYNLKRAMLFYRDLLVTKKKEE